MKHQLDFEKPIIELQNKLEELRQHPEKHSLGISFEEELRIIERKLEETRRQVFLNLTAWQRVQLARHPKRPYTLDYIEAIFTDFEELHGDRSFADDSAIVGGMARFNGQSVMVIGHQKGRDTKEKIYRNFGMPRPEGYRKALRIMKMAERFKIPIICLIDTPGAYPGIGAEERGQSEAIARNLFEMSKLRTPIICTVIGEGGSGGALAIGVGDRLIMLEYSTYSVISPEGCASILWKSADKSQLAAEAMGITSDRVREQGFLDEVVREPLGGGHRDFKIIALNLKEALIRHLAELKHKSIDDLLENRYQRIMDFGVFTEEAGK